MGFGLSGMTGGLLRLFLSTIDRTTTRKNLLFGPAGYDCTFGIVKRAFIQALEARLRAGADLGVSDSCMIRLQLAVGVLTKT
ncbi:hypothetical protein BFJ63_vAg10816 [Fusarium oxysporum f. sp. narcissi]|uniref:Uncharacterized protein n=1 Tax=Fusarium oxysporum f. sp. narcissi TaxID=451672 RepID=A0A4Q2VGB7_FUSOX|nr:hypothetical protein BFJ71_g7956 [Fusarium oxysporum]RKL35259.1 hypothetical protein BFJ70_g8116 [Fusarium oxysporum]RYC86292.1 hypothetical protein BFJ63_vAg10816 [Fusarium oxysporum f. sp. narcissi]